MEMKKYDLGCNSQKSYGFNLTPGEMRSIQAEAWSTNLQDLACSRHRFSATVTLSP